MEETSRGGSGASGAATPSAAAREPFLRRNRGWVVTAAYLSLAGLLGWIGMSQQLSLPLDILIVMGEPAASIGASKIGAWPAVVFGVLLNAFAIGWAMTALARFSSRMDGMVDLAGRVYGRSSD